MTLSWIHHYIPVNALLGAHYGNYCGLFARVFYVGSVCFHTVIANGCSYFSSIEILYVFCSSLSSFIDVQAMDDRVITLCQLGSSPGPTNKTQTLWGVATGHVVPCMVMGKAMIVFAIAK